MCIFLLLFCDKLGKLAWRYAQCEKVCFCDTVICITFVSDLFHTTYTYNNNNDIESSSWLIRGLKLRMINCVSMIRKIVLRRRVQLGRTGAVVSVADYGPRGPWFETWRGTVCCGIEQVTFTHCLVLVKPRKLWTDD